MWTWHGHQSRWSNDGRIRIKCKWCRQWHNMGQHDYERCENERKESENAGTDQSCR